jgi:hypothetical protein
MAGGGFLVAANRKEQGMDEAMTQARVLALLRAARREWEALLAEVPPDRMTEPGVEGTWSVKDIVAHVAWGEREIVPVFRDHVLAGSSLWELPLDARNAAMVAAARDQPLEAVLSEEHAAYAELLAILESLDDSDMTDAGRFRDMPADWQPWRLISGNTYDHYPDHIPTIRAWLAKQ